LHISAKKKSVLCSLYVLESNSELYFSYVQLNGSHLCFSFYVLDSNCQLYFSAFSYTILRYVSPYIHVSLSELSPYLHVSCYKLCVSVRAGIPF